MVKRWLIIVVVFASGLAVGVVAVLASRSSGGANRQVASGAPSTESTQSNQLYTCGMHPQVIQDKPGNCPICHMKLVPLKSDSDDGASSQPTGAGGKGQRKILYWWDPMLGPGSISDKPGKSAMGMDLVPKYADEASAGPVVRIDPTIVQNMGVRTAEVTKGPLELTIRTVGVLMVPEPGLHDISLKINGWIDKLYADTEGMMVKKDQPLFDLYSPDLQVAEEELITAVRSLKTLDPQAAQPVRTEAQSLLESAKRKLRLWDISDQDIEAIASAHRAPRTVTFRSPADGYVVEKQVVQGSAVQMGMKLMRIEDHSKLWLDAQVYEEQLPWVSMGQKVEATVDGVPHKMFTGMVSFIYPRVDHMTRTETVRTTIDNPNRELRPGMYATAKIMARPFESAILVPREAVIDTGTRQIAFVTAADGRFQPRKVRMGLRGDERVQILEGLAPGETVVTSGQFLMDVESRTTEAIEKLRKGAAGSSGAGAEQPTSMPAMPAPAATASTPLAEGQAKLAVAHCPMKKADWIQSGDEIANPYYGQQMSGCGQVTKHLAAPAEGSPLKKVADAYLSVQKDLNADKLSAEHNDPLKTASDSLEGEKYKSLRSAAQKFAEAKDIAAARAAFQTVSGELIRVLDESSK